MSDTDSALPEKVGPGHPPRWAAFKPGVSGNPGGGHRGLSRYVREKYGDRGDELVRYLGVLITGTPKELRATFGTSKGVRMGERLKAIELLLRYGWGVPQPDDGITQMARQVIFNIPRPPRELEGQQVVVGMQLAPRVIDHEGEDDK